MSDDFSFDDDDNGGQEQPRKLTPEEELARLVVRSQQGPDPSPAQTSTSDKMTALATATAPSNGGTTPESSASAAVTSVAIAPSPPAPQPAAAPAQPQRATTPPVAVATPAVAATVPAPQKASLGQVLAQPPATTNGPGVQQLTKISEIIRALILQNPRNPSALSIAIDWIRRDPLGEHNGVTYQALLELRLADVDVILMAVRWLTEHYDHPCSARIVELLAEYTAGK